MSADLKTKHIKIFNKKFLEEMKTANENLELGFSDYECECYANFFEILNQALSDKLSFQDLFTSYDFFTDVIFGNQPNLIVTLPKEERFKTIHRMSRRYSITKNFTDYERELYAFSILYASCIRKCDEETQTDTWSMEDFTSLKKLKEMYKWYQKKFPNQYTPQKRLSDSSKENYGLSSENPIEVLWVKTEYEYLSGLMCTDGSKVTFVRVGSTSVDGFDHPIDIFTATKKGMLGKKKVADVYIYGYGYDNGIDAPKGFRFMMEEDL